MNLLTRTYTRFPLSQKLFALGVLLSVLPSVRWLFDAWIFDAHDTVGIWGGLTLIALLFWSVSSKKNSCRQENTKLIVSLFTVASILQFFNLGINENLVKGIVLIVDSYAVFLWLNLRYRQKPLSAEWLTVLLIFSLPINLPGAGVNTLVITGAVLAVLMAIARPSLIASFLSLSLLTGLGLLGSSLRFYFDARGGVMEIAALIPELIAVLLWFYWIYQKPSKPHAFKDTTCWTVPNCVKQDGWWLELPKLRRIRAAWTMASVAFVGVSLFTAFA